MITLVRGLSKAITDNEVDDATNLTNTQPKRYMAPHEGRLSTRSKHCDSNEEFSCSIIRQQQHHNVSDRASNGSTTGISQRSTAATLTPNSVLRCECSRHAHESGFEYNPTRYKTMCIRFNKFIQFSFSIQCVLESGNRLVIDQYLIVQDLTFIPIMGH